MRLCTVATLANQQLQRLIDEPQEFRARGTSVRDDMDSRGTDAIFGEHFNGDKVSSRSARPPRFGTRPYDLELVRDSFNGVVMLVDRHLDFSLRHGCPPFRGKAVVIGSTSIALLSISGPKVNRGNPKGFARVRNRQTGKCSGLRQEREATLEKDQNIDMSDVTE